MHGRSPERYKARDLRSVLAWGAAGPAAILLAAALAVAGAAPLWPAAAGLATYPAMAARIALGRRRRFGDPWQRAAAYGAFTMLGKLAQAQGAARFLLRRRRAGPATLIEYKGAAR